jgi:hypothetical protein
VPCGSSSSSRASPPPPPPPGANLTLFLRSLSPPRALLVFLDPPGLRVDLGLPLLASLVAVFIVVVEATEIGVLAAVLEVKMLVPGADVGVDGELTADKG